MSDARHGTPRPDCDPIDPSFNQECRELIAVMNRITYLDGMRGFASLQVVLGHCLLAFSPSAFESPAKFLWEGNVAVFVFFLMSGFVLAYSFERTPRDVARLAGKRIARLLLPVSASVLVALALLSVLPGLHFIAADASQSAWLASMGPKDLGGTLADMTGVSLFAGYENTGLVPDLALPWTVSDSVNAPLWSLHVELWGSFLLIGLAYCRHVSRDAYFAALALCLLLIQGNALNLFVLGALLAAFVRTPTFDALSGHVLAVPVALIALFAGIVLAADLVALPWLKRADAWGRAVAPYSFFNPQKQLAAILIFMALFFLPVAQRALARPVAAWLGRLSFSVYLLHFPVLLTAGSLAYVAAGTAAAIAVVLIATLAAAVLFERYVDRPAIRLARALGAKRHSSPGLGNGADGGVKAPL